MKLLRTISGGIPICINPDKVIKLEPYTEDSNATYVTLEGIDNDVVVEGGIDFVAGCLEERSKN